MEFKIPEPDLRFLQPARGIQREFQGTQIVKDAGNVIRAGNKVAKEKGLREDLEELTNEFISPADADTLNEFTKEATRLSGMKGLNREAEFKVRAEAKLKEYLTRAPALSTELRGVAAQVLGFDPSGSLLDAKFAELDLEKGAQKSIRDTILKQAASWNMDITKFGTAEFMQEYEDRRATENKLQTLDNNTKFNSRNVNVLTKGLLQDQTSIINGNIESLFPGKNLDNITPAEVASIDPASRTQFITELERGKLDVEARIRIKFPTANETVINNVVAMVSAQSDYLISRLDPKDDATRIKNKYDTVVGLDAINILGTDSGRQAAAWSFMSDTPLGARFATVAQGEALQVISGLTSGSNVAVDPALDAGDKQAVIKTVGNTTKEWMKGVDYNNLSTEDQELAGKFMDNYTRMMDDESLNPNQKQELLSALADSEVKDFLKALPADREVMLNTLSTAGDYAVAVSSAAANELAETMMVDTSRNPNPRSIRRKPLMDVVSGQLIKGQVVLATNDKTRTAVVNKLRKKYVNRINTAIRATANVLDVPLEEAANILFSQNIDAFSWIEGIETKNVLEDGGETFNIVGAP